MSHEPNRTNLLLIGSGFLCVIIVVSAVVSGPAEVFAQGPQPQLLYADFAPTVIRSDRTQPVLFQARVSGSSARVVFEYTTSAPTGIDFEMRDDGSGGDPQAGDGVYTVAVPAAQITQGLQTDDVFRRFVGFIKIFQNTTLVLRGNVFAQVITDEIMRAAVIRVTPDIQYTDHIVNIVDSAFVTSGTIADIPRITKRFYQFFPDDNSFLNVVYDSARFQNPFHFVVKNDVRGIGLGTFDGTANYGSLGALLGFSVFPISGFFDGADDVYQHELGHQWVNFLSVPPLNQGSPHWPISSLASGIMGFSIPPNVGGEFPCLLVSEPGGIRLVPVPLSTARVFTDLDLYLMGMLPPDQVGEHIVFTDQAAARNLPCNGQLFNGQVTRIKISDIVTVAGARVPDSATAPKHFKVLTIVVSTGLLSEDAMAFYNFFAQRAEETREVPTHTGFVKRMSKPFALSTRGLGTLSAHVTAPRLIAGETSTAAVALDSVTWVRDPFSFTTDLNFSSDRRTRIMLFAANLKLGPGESTSVITAQAEDSQQRVFPLPVEFVGQVPNLDWLTQINLRLPDEAQNGGSLSVSISVRGLPSNRVQVRIR